MWIPFALLSMMGSGLWFINAKIFPHENPFAVMAIGGLILALLGMALSFVTYNVLVDTTAIKPAIGYALGSLMATAGLFFALNNGGPLAGTSLLIELWIVLVALLGWWFWGESLSTTQLVGFALVCGGLVLFLRA